MGWGGGGPGERVCWVNLAVAGGGTEVRLGSPAFNSTMNGIDDDSPWDTDPNPSYAHQSEWSKIASDFTNVRHWLPTTQSTQKLGI